MNISGPVLAKNKPEIVAKLVAIANRVAAKVIDEYFRASVS